MITSGQRQLLKLFIPDAPLHLKSSGRKSERDQRYYSGRDESAAVNLPSRRAQLPDYRFILNALFARVHVARPARSHSDSSLFPRLKKSQTRYPDGKENDDTEHAWHLKDNQPEGQSDAYSQSDDAH
jgi:hypothetical protein